MADCHPLNLAINDNEDQIENEEEDTLAGNEDIEREGEQEQRPMDLSRIEGRDSMAVSNDGDEDMEGHIDRFHGNDGSNDKEGHDDKGQHGGDEEEEGGDNLPDEEEEEEDYGYKVNLDRVDEDSDKEWLEDDISDDLDSQVRPEDDDGDEDEVNQLGFANL